MGTGRRSPLYEIQAASIGYRARQALAAARQASDRETRVLGTTSRGLFLQGPERQIMFLSYERYRSPLTITLGAPAPALHTVANGDAALVHSERLTFPAAKVAVVLPDGTWRPAAPPAELRPLKDRVEGLKQMAKAIAEAGKERELGRLLRPLLSLPRETALPAEQRWLLEVVVALQGKLRDGDGEGAATIASRLLGRGRGLTASGDDFLIGLLVFASRYPAAVRPAFPCAAFGRAVVDAAREKTTAISANLIACAADGDSDERLLAAADCIATGSPPARECLPPLMGWGASSGVDALAGMACAVTL